MLSAAIFHLFVSRQSATVSIKVAPHSPSCAAIGVGAAHTQLSHSCRPTLVFAHRFLSPLRKPARPRFALSSICLPSAFCMTCTVRVTFLSRHFRQVRRQCWVEQRDGATANLAPLLGHPNCVWPSASSDRMPVASGGRERLPVAGATRPRSCPHMRGRPLRSCLLGSLEPQPAGRVLLVAGRALVADLFARRVGAACARAG
jgi:hypothetical protein